MQSHSHRVTFGNIELHLPLDLSEPKTVKIFLQNETVFIGKRELVALLNLSSWRLVMVERLFLAVPWDCLRFVIVVFPDYTHFYICNEWTFVYRTHLSVNRRTEDLILFSKSFKKIRKRIDPKTDPWLHPIKQGLDLRLDRLRLLVDCAQRVMSWSLIESSLCNSLLCGTLSKAFAKSIMIKSVCLCPWSSHHSGCWWYRAQTAPAGFYKTSESHELFGIEYFKTEVKRYKSFNICHLNRFWNDILRTSCTSVCWCLVVTCWEMFDLLALVCDV